MVRRNHTADAATAATVTPIESAVDEITNDGGGLRGEQPEAGRSIGQADRRPTSRTSGGRSDARGRRSARRAAAREVAREPSGEGTVEHHGHEERARRGQMPADRRLHEVEEGAPGRDGEAERSEAAERRPGSTCPRTCRRVATATRSRPRPTERGADGHHGLGETRDQHEDGGGDDRPPRSPRAAARRKTSLSLRRTS